MVVLFLVVLTVSSSLAARNGCVSHHLSLDKKLELNADINDYDGNGIINTPDIIHDLRHNYDTNATGFPRSAFIDTNRKRYELFEQDKCVNRDLTVDQKLDINLACNNHNNDSVVDSSDVAYDLNNNYDTNNDTKVSQAEWVLRWCCAFGDTSDYARYVWDQLTQGADFTQASQFSGPPFDTGIPLDQFVAMNRKRYETYAAMQTQPPVGK